MSMLVDVKIMERGDPGPAFPDVHGDKVVRAELSRLVVLQGGMMSGEASVCLLGRIEGTDKWAVVECSANMLECMAASAKGARIRWGEVQG